MHVCENAQLQFILWWMYKIMRAVIRCDYLIPWFSTSEVIHTVILRNDAR